MSALSYHAFKLCLCGSKKTYRQCCGPRLSGFSAAETPEALMRSRYSAYALQDAQYILATWHSSTRPDTLELDAGTQWLRLTVRRAGGHSVSFTAQYKEGGAHHELRECSQFVRENGQWFYLDGVLD